MGVFGTTLVALLAFADVEGLLQRMTLDEKLALVHGARDPKTLGQAGFWPGLPRLGIPPLRLADGPPGINVNRDATGMPAPVGLAAAFNPALARRYGELLGREARTLGQDVVLAPYINIVRDPLFRRNHTTLSEDPLLNGMLASALVEGIQSQGVMAQVKHLAVYNGMDNVEVDERTLREIYLPSFEMAVRAGAASAMCAYNRVNGAPSCENSRILNGILRGEWGFKGFVTSDWGALRGPMSITQGVDLEMPGREIIGRGGPHYTTALKEAVEKGEIPTAAIDEAVRRILGQMEKFGLLGRSEAPAAELDVEAGAKIAREVATQSAVLLKNDDGVLPLTEKDLESLAVIGPTARQLASGFMGERAYGFEARMISPLEALRKLTPRANISYAPGGNLSGDPLPVTSGILLVAKDGEYAFMVQPKSGEGGIFINGMAVARSSGFRGFGLVERKWSSLLPTPDGRDNARGIGHLRAGEYQITTVSSQTSRTPADVRFAWMTPESRRLEIEAAVALARSARTAIVFAWHEPGNTFAFAEEQDLLIRQVAEANPRTIVVLNTGGPVAMPWKDSVMAILAMWFPGQEGGWATADLLLGRAAPGGKLPVTFPARLEDTPAHAAGHPERWAPLAAPGTTGLNPNPPLVKFSEGLAVGYRWYDQQRIEPLFPFGHGLSYTQFQYSDLSVRAAGGGFDVSFTLRNVGARGGSEVAQVYLNAADKGSPPRALAGFERVELEAGRSTRVTVRINERALSYWSPEKRGWVRAVNGRTSYVGSSSRDIRLEGPLAPTIRRQSATRPR